MRPTFLCFLVLAALAVSAPAQMMAPPADDATKPAAAASDSSNTAPAPAVAHATPQTQAAAQKIVARAQTAHVADTPLSPAERAQQMLNRFTFGPRPGDLQAVEATGAQQWFERQLNYARIDDSAVEKRIARDYPALTLSSAQYIAAFPGRAIVQDVANSKLAYPTDPLEAGLYEAMVYRYQQERDARNIATATMTDDQVAAKKKVDQATALRIAGEIFALPKKDRMLALMKMPVADRVTFAREINGDQRNELLADFSPRERELFQALSSNVDASGLVQSELQQAKIIRAVLSQRQLLEVMTDFWFNHFNVYVAKNEVRWYTNDYERNIIRAHALGKFHDLLFATATSPAMMVYLDNYTSIGPDSPANVSANGKHGSRGLNENYAREVMELHTLSVNGGYTQSDVTQLARILTGWGVDKSQYGGPFEFNEKNHEPGVKQWLGQTVKEDGMAEGLRALTTLAASPRTAHFISYLLAQRFVADNPPPALVDRMAHTYLATDGDISAILRTLVTSPEFNSHRYYRNKVKTPMEFVASTLRATATDPSNPGTLVGTLNNMGMPLYLALPPTGYYITAEQWMNTAALLDRLNFSLALTRGGLGGMSVDSPRLLALEMMAEPQQTLAQNAAHPAAHAVNATAVVPGAPAAPMPGSGEDVVLGVMEQALLGNSISPHTDEFLRTQAAAQAQPLSPTDRISLFTGLLLGSPEFQMR